MPLRIVQSKHNPRLKQLRAALTQPLRKSAEAGRALAGIEGPNLLAEAVRAGLHIECVFIAQGSEQLLEALSLPAEIEILSLPKALLDSLLTTENPQPVAALIEPPRWTWDDVIGRGSVPLILVLAGLQDPGNLGTILRSAEAFGATAILSLPGTVSPWNPKALRASAGSAFRLPSLAVEPEECFTRLRAARIRIFTTALRDADAASDINLASPTAILIGNEGNGVPSDLAAQADAAITIPCPGPVESLNAAIAASILLYEAARQRTAVIKPGGKSR